MSRLQSVLRVAAQLVLYLPGRTPVLSYVPLPLVEFPSACHVQVMSTGIQVCLHRLAPDYLSHFCKLLTSVPGHPQLRSADANKLLVLQSCTTSFGPHSFGSSGPTAWNDIPAHLCNSKLNS